MVNRYILFVTQCQMGMIKDDGQITYFESDYLKQYNKNKADIQTKNAWKHQGTGAKFMGIGSELLGEEKTYAQLTGICWGQEVGEWIYAIQVDDFFGIYKKNGFKLDELEGHILHTNRVALFDLDYSQEQDRIVFSLGEDGQRRHIGLMDPITSKYQIVTEGDAIDRYPSWSKTHKDTIFYASCGLGSNEDQQVTGRSEYGIYRLQLTYPEIEELVYHKKHDCIKPKEDRWGNLYYIKKPKETQDEDKDFITSLIDFVLIPWKLARAIGVWMDFFTRSYGEEQLFSGNGIKARKKNKEELWIEGNLIKLKGQEKKSQRKEEVFSGVIPSNWQLMKRTASGEEVLLKKGVLDFTIDEEGVIVYSNGSYLITLHSDGTETKLAEVALGTHLKSVSVK